MELRAAELAAEIVQILQARGEFERDALEAEGGVDNELYALKAQLGLVTPELPGMDDELEMLPEPDELEAFPDDTEILEADKEALPGDAEEESETDKA